MVADVKALFDKQGYVIVPGLIDDQDRAELEAACERVIQRTRSGSWPYRRTVGKQFPPFDNDNPDSWGVQHLMHPELKEPAFAKWYTSKPLLGTAKDLLQCKDDDLQMGEYFPILVDPDTQPSC